MTRHDTGWIRCLRAHDDERLRVRRQAAPQARRGDDFGDDEGVCRRTGDEGRYGRLVGLAATGGRIGRPQQRIPLAAPVGCMSVATHRRDHLDGSRIEDVVDDAVA